MSYAKQNILFVLFTLLLIAACGGNVTDGNTFQTSASALEKEGDGEVSVPKLPDYQGDGGWCIDVGFDPAGRAYPTYLCPQQTTNECSSDADCGGNACWYCSAGNKAYTFCASKPRCPDYLILK